MNIVDFEKEFSAHWLSWSKDHAHIIPQEEIPDHLEDVYIEWENSHQSWAGGKPADFFSSIDDINALINLLLAYHEKRLSIPLPLLARVHAVGEKSPAPLLAALKDASIPLPIKKHVADILLALSHMPAILHMQETILGHAREEISAYYSDILLSTKSYGSWALSAFQDAPREAQYLLLSFLPDIPQEESANLAIRFLETETDDKNLPYIAGILSQIGDPRAAYPLMERLKEPLGYLSYHEICFAIEALGGDIPDIAIRDFEDDPDYQSIAMQEE